MSTPASKVVIYSPTFKRYVRMDASGVTKFEPAGSGIVNTQSFIGAWETFFLELNNSSTAKDQGTVSFKSASWEGGIYLRLDPSKPLAGTMKPSGDGVANCQKGKFSYEKFRIVPKDGDSSGIVYLESFAFPGVYLRMDGAKNQVNAQGGKGLYEEFKILVVS